MIRSKKERMKYIIDTLSKDYPDVKIQLDFTSPFELLIATILSAQCTDARVNIVTKDLFAKYLTPEDYLKVPIEELEKDIYSTGFYRAKAKSITGACDMILNKFDGKVPDNMENLLKLPGVGRKTANVLLGHCFDTPGIVVDTHVIRLSNRMGFVNTKDAVKIEFELMKLIEKELWVIFTHYFINHGRKICVRSPKCNKCSIATECKKVGI
jgi:endonuclease-3